MDRRPETAELTPGDYLRPIWRYRWMVLLVTLVAAAGAYVHYDRQPERYETAAQLYVGQSSIDQLMGTAVSSGSERMLANQARLVTTPQVADEVARRLGLEVPPLSLLGSVEVRADPQADFLSILAFAGDPRLAADLANGFAQAYLAVRRAALRESAERALAAAREQEAQLDPGALDVVERSEVRQRISTLESAVLAPPSVGEQVRPAPVPQTPSEPRPVRNAIFAGLLALLLTVVVAYLLDRSDRRVRRVDDVEKLYDAPILATIPHVRRPLPRGREGAVTVPELQEPYRSLRVGVDLLRKPEGLQTLLVASALSGEGKSTVVRNLAIAYRDAGLEVAVVEADLRRPSLATAFDVEPEPGLAETLRRRDGERPPLQYVSDGIEVLVAGVPPENPTALLTPERLRPVLALLAASHDVVLVDAPPLLGVGDALPMLSLVDGVVLVVRANQATRASAARLRKVLGRVAGARVLGTVVNDAARDDTTYDHAAPAPRATVNGGDPTSDPATVERR